MPRRRCRSPGPSPARTAGWCCSPASGTTSRRRPASTTSTARSGSRSSPSRVASCSTGGRRRPSSSSRRRCPARSSAWRPTAGVASVRHCSGAPPRRWSATSTVHCSSSALARGTRRTASRPRTSSSPSTPLRPRRRWSRSRPAWPTGSTCTRGWWSPSDRRPTPSSSTRRPRPVSPRRGVSPTPRSWRPPTGSRPMPRSSSPTTLRTGIVGFARDLPATYLVMGSHGRRGMARVALGSVAMRVVHRSPCPVLVVRP